MRSQAFKTKSRKERRRIEFYEKRMTVVDVQLGGGHLLRVSSLLDGQVKRAKLTMHKPNNGTLVKNSIRVAIDIHELDQLIKGLVDARTAIVEAMQRERGAA